MKLNVKYLSWVLMGYMSLAFFWWAVHLWNQNDRLLVVEKQLWDHKKSEQSVEQSNIDLLEIDKRYKRKKGMVLGEGLFFLACLVVGFYLIDRSVKHEVSLARQRKNFMLSITHELKSPIAAIRLLFETICKRELEKDKVEKLCMNGVRDASRLQMLVEGLLLAARLEDNWKPLAEPVDIKPLLQDIIASLKMRYEGSRFELEIPDGFPPFKADRVGLTAIAQNLLENAIKYSPEKGPIVVSVGKKDDRCILQVADQGIGIPDQEKKAVLEQFYRVGNEDTRRTAGTGLGLYIVNQVVLAHGGKLSIQDNSPQGTVIKVLI
ncbi:MAG: HAMP domain-containing sensor histidine kinase [Saprospiraceae bacterium]